MNNKSIDNILDRLNGVKPAGEGKWQALCPAHDDHNPSLGIGIGDDGRVLLKCHAGCTTDAICQAMHITTSDLFDDSSPSSAKVGKTYREPDKRTYATADAAIRDLEIQTMGKLKGQWVYTDGLGREVMQVLRFQQSNGNKTYRPIHAVENGWAIGKPQGQLPLYRLQELQGAQRVYITEGEKAADAAHDLGLTATTSAHGAQSPHKADWSPLADKEIIILPDNDEAGRKYAEAVSAILGRLTPAPLVKIVELPGLPNHGDIVEYIAASDDAPACALHDAIEALADQAQPLMHENPIPTIDRFRPFPVDALPEPVSSFIMQSAEAIGCDTSFIALPILTAAASAIGNSRCIQLKRGWTEPAILWTGIVGDSGTLKTPAFKLAMAPIRKRQSEALKQHDEAMSLYEHEIAEYERIHQQWKRKGEGNPPIKPDEPDARRFIVSDTTVEALAPILLANQRGLLLARDELAGWIGSFDRYAGGKSGTDSANWLSMHNAENIIVDRKTGQPRTICIPRASTCITGGIQPAIMSRVLGAEHRESGLAARFLLAWPPRKAKRWTEAEISASAEAAIAGIFDRLYELQGCIDEYGDLNPGIVTLTPMGKRQWIDFYNTHAQEQSDLTGDLSAAWSKLEGYAARLALVVHFVRWAANDATLHDVNAVDEVSIAAGVRLSQWFGNEARRVYAMLGESEEDSDTRRLVELIERKGGVVTPRIMMRTSRQYKTSAEAENALASLIEAGYGRWETSSPGQKGGKPTRRFALVDTVDVDNTPNNDTVSDGIVNVNAVNGSHQMAIP